MASSNIDNELLPEQTEGFKVGEKKTIDEYQKLEKIPHGGHWDFAEEFNIIAQPRLLLVRKNADDEAMQRYKRSLGLGGDGKDISDPNDPRQCIILSLTMDSQGREPVTIDLSEKGSETTLKDKPFKIKEGTKFSMTAKFKVQHEILSGLHYVQIVKRKGIRVSKDQEMIGSYAPNTDKNPFYTKRFAEEDAPSGMLARGHYTAVSTFIDDDKKTHLQFEWAFDIAKDW
ncbi:Rho GDP-dissociation inhibitor [Erysiphe necator]|nr:Rho GDP-dissociation inhibitor [Erysiphe necator]